MERLKKTLRDNLWIVLLDIIAVNGAYLLALLIRFYVHFKFTSAIGDFREYYLQFTPYYTILCLIVFYVCGLYNGMWRYAGLSDMNLIIVASVITAIIQVVGTRLFVYRMPTSYYLIGGFLQFLMIATIRFAYRFLEVRRRKNRKQKALTIPAMVVGSDERGREFARYLEERSPFQVMAIAGKGGGKVMDGIPIVDYVTIPAQIQLYDIKTIFLADESLDEGKKEEIIREAQGVEVRDYIAYLSDSVERIPVNSLLKYAVGPITVSVDGFEKQYPDANICMEALADRYEVIGLRNTIVELAPINETAPRA